MIERYPFPQKRISRILLGLLMLGLLYTTRDSMPCTTFLGFYASQAISIALMGVTAGTFLIYNRHSLKAVFTDRRVVIAIGFAVIVLVPMLVKQDWQLMYFTMLMGIFFGILVSYFLSVREAAKYYVVIMTGLAAFSVFAHYVLRPLGEAGIMTPPVVVNGFGADFFNYGLSFPTLFDPTKSRNYGIFREPGVYQYFLYVALYLNNYRVDWKYGWQLWTANVILAVTMLSTLATGGVIEMGLLIGVLFFDKKWYKSRLGRIVTAACVAGGAVILAVLIIKKPPIYWQLYLMMAKLFAGEDSIVDRLGSIMANLNAFAASPIVGGRISDVLYAVENNTSSTTVLLAVLGTLGGCSHIIACGALVWDKDRFILWNLGLLAILMMSFNTQNLITNPFFWLMPVMALTERMLPLLKKER